MPQIYNCESIQEALELANQFKQQKRYDYFRGQRQNWRVKSSVGRLDLKERSYIQNVEVPSLLKWIEEHEILASENYSTDQIIAIAQHYGIPTPFVDFTTEPQVAAYFASDSNGDGSHSSCIICVDESDFNDFWQQIVRASVRHVKPEFISFQVSNLWRLETQAGLFLFNPCDDIESIYDFDRIVFPCGSNDSILPESYIYPDRKSKLEIQLDEYFSERKRLRNFERLQSENSFRKVPVFIEDGDVYPPLINETCFPEFLPSWNENEVGQWLTYDCESYFNVVRGKTLSIPIEEDCDISLVVSELLNADSSLRNEALDWRVEHKQCDSIAEFLNRLWDEMRYLPFTNEQIAVAIERVVHEYIYMQQVEVPENLHRHPLLLRDFVYQKATQLLFIDFGDKDRGYSRSYVTEQGLQSCLAEGIESCLKFVDDLQVSQIPRMILQAIRNPSLAYEFDKFVDLYASEIIPRQVLIRDLDDMLFCNPARVNRFGLA